MTSETDGRLLAEGWGALVGYDYTGGHAAPLADELVDALRAQGAEPEEARPRPTPRSSVAHAASEAGLS